MASSKEKDQSEDKKNDPPAATQWQNANTSGKVSDFMASPGVKFILTGVITLALLIPTLMIWGLVEERSKRADEVAQSISKGWGGEQLINGPYLVLPYTIAENASQNFKRVRKFAIISPDTLTIDGNIDVNERRKAIYKTQLYHLKSRVSGSFGAVDLNVIQDAGGTPIPDQAFIAIGVTDMTGIRSDLKIDIEGIGERTFLPGLNRLQGSHAIRKHVSKVAYSGVRLHKTGGVHLPVSRDQIGKGFKFNLAFALNGSQNLTFVPAGSTTGLKLKSNWPHPGFEGRFLPEKRNITEDGFQADWTIPSLARGIDKVTLGNALPVDASTISVNFVEPLKFYQVTARTLKYAIAFFSLVFLTVFVMELTGRKAIHWVQYVLVGFAMVIFYALLLALSEQIGFSLAYAFSAIATTALIAWYVGDALGGRNHTLTMGGLLGTTYLVMYLILNEEVYALLAGSIISFAAVAATMFVTRKVEWSKRTTAQ